MSFRLKTVLGVGLIELLLLSALVFSALSTLRTTNEDALASEARSVVAMFATLSQDAVISGDLATLDTFTSHLIKLDRVTFVRILDNSGLTLSQRGSAPDTGNAEDSLHVSAPVSEGGYAFGSVEIVFATSFIDVLVDGASTKLATLASIELLLSALFSFALGTYLTRQLARLRDTARKISAGDVGAQMHVEGRDEIAQTARSINRMSRRLKVSYETLSDREKRTRDLLSNIAEAVVTLDCDGNIQDFNFAAERLFGYPAEDLIGHPFASSLVELPPEEGPCSAELLFAKVGASGKKTCTEYNGRRRTGTNFPMEICISRIELETETCYSCVIRDLTAKRKEEETSRLVRKVFESSGEALIVTDAARRIVAANPAFSRATGFREEKLVGRLSTELHREATDPDHPGKLYDAVLKHGQWSGEVEHLRKNGKTFPAWMTISSIDDEAGNITNFVIIFRDITEQKRIERLKSEFVSTVSHELRTPLTVIKGSLDLVRSGTFGDLPEKADKLLAKASDNSERLGNLINDILDMEKIESGSMEYVKEELPVSDLLRDAVSAYGGYASDRSVRFIIVGGHIDSCIHADKSRMMQVMANFMSNAAKFSPDGTNVEISAARSPKGHVRISVKDRGPGIPEDAQASIFEKFVQADASDTRAKSGTGLGLNIAKRIVEDHEGGIGFATEVGTGTEFYFDLPEADEASAQSRPAAARQLAS